MEMQKTLEKSFPHRFWAIAIILPNSLNTPGLAQNRARSLCNKRMLSLVYSIHLGEQSSAGGSEVFQYGYPRVQPLATNELDQNHHKPVDEVGLL